MDSESLKILDSYVRRTWDTGNHSEQWRNLPEIPNKAEIMPEEEEETNIKRYDERWNDYQNEPTYDPNLPKNIIKGPWPSKEDYISAHYQILREDAIAPLRQSIKNFKANRNMCDDKNTCVYTHVHFKGLRLAPTGAAFTVEFSTERAGKQIRWEQSKRLFQGSMVALSPASDMFEKVCKIAIVAARPILGGLDQNPPRIDLFWGDHTDAAFDPVEAYVMIEARTGYFEAYRHVLPGLQKLRTERFSLANHIADLDPNVGPPTYLKEHSILDLSSLCPSDSDGEALSSVESDDYDLHNVDILEHFPEVLKSGMDISQTSALKRIVTKSVAVIQGPPGTGKTFTSVSSIRVMLNNLRPEDPPIIIAAQTNHALDQLLSHILTSEERIVRLGGRSDKENVEIIKRTLYELHIATTDFPNGLRGLKVCKVQLEQKINEIQRLMSPLLTATILTDEILLQRGLIRETQKDSLYETGWLETNQSQTSNDFSFTALSSWLGEDGLVPMPRTPRINLGLPLEEADLEYEQLQELEHELEGAEFQEAKGREALWGKWLPFLRDFTGRASTGLDDRKAKKFLASHDNLYDIPEIWRSSIYRYWEKRLNKECLEKLKPLLADYKRIVETTKITKWHNNIKLIRHLNTKLIGCTTTGLSKYRPLLAALQPRILLIEEAAETLEGSVIPGMFDSLEHLILVGDHKQLQAQSNIQALQGAPYHMGVSMFERLISNSMGFSMLNTQRRMIPDIRKLLCIGPKPFYTELHDHPSVKDRVVNRAPVPGMGGKDTYFFHHTWPESRGTDLSRYNQDEAEMIVGFFQHLVLNGIKHSKITILTFYNGQRKTILKELKKHPGLRVNTYFNVFTVDGYQGEENDIILLSLVRSNDSLGIGFLESRNRLVVALSRARRGLYLFGNAITLTAAETGHGGPGRDILWTPIINYFNIQDRFDLDGGLPITCSNHGTTLEIREAEQWLGLVGGCNKDCGGILPCGHNCPLKCHSFKHSMVVCRIACPRTLACGHGCSHFCGEPCECSHRDQSQGIVDDGDHMMPTARYRGYSLSEQTIDILYGSDDGTPSRSSKLSPHKGFPLGSQSGKDSPFDTDSAQNSDPGMSYDPMANSGSLSATRSRNPTFMSPNTLPMRSGPGAPGQWQDWDAKKFDAEVAEKARLTEAENPKADVSKLVYKDTWRPVSIENGMRSISGPDRMFIRRFGNNDKSPTHGAPSTPRHVIDAAAVASERAEMTDIVMKMTGFSFFNNHSVRNYTTPGPALTGSGNLMGLELPVSARNTACALAAAYTEAPATHGEGQNGLHTTIVAKAVSSTLDSSCDSIVKVTSLVKEALVNANPPEMAESEDLIDLNDPDPPFVVSSSASKVASTALIDILG